VLVPIFIVFVPVADAAILTVPDVTLPNMLIVAVVKPVLNKANVPVVTLVAIVGLFIVSVPEDVEPSVMVVAAPPIFRIVAPVLKSVTVPDAVVRVGPVPKVIVGDAAPKVIAVALGNVTVAFLMLPVPVVAPRLRVVAA
jgi:hypothetical protein